LDAETTRLLDELSKEMQRSRSFLIAEAVREWVECEYAHLCDVRQGETEIDAGKTVPHSAIQSWVEDLRKGKNGKPDFAA
jgi:predicted transcriptional regulator